ncbi:MAG: methylated-DNA--[protein]-cysteine S-methyltransferase [Thermoplasmata archaeon]|nr:MAG: methylated-DNA--[protein]-cysteine S-methyltransferase [Thermoplasmata archaeon]
MDLYEETYELTKQIPRGKVSTYGAIAMALGDKIASRAVGIMLNQNPYKEVPCYRVIHSDGRIGGYASGVEKKIELLKKDGIEIKNGRIDLKKYLFDDFATSYPLKKLREEQEKLRKKVVIDDDVEANRIAGVDVSYSKKYAYGAYVEFDKNGNIVKKKIVKKKITFPYIPTYLAYRELPVLNELIEGEEPSIVMVDGNGLLHPRFFGLASHFGVVNNVATIGIAKKLLLGEVIKNDVFIGERKVGKKLGKIFVSPGNKISVEKAYEITKKFMKYSIPEPIRMAHILANEARRKER